MLQCVPSDESDGHLPLFGGSFVISNLLVNIKLEDVSERYNITFSMQHIRNRCPQEFIMDCAPGICWSLSQTDSNTGLVQVDRTVRHVRPAKVIISRPSYA